MLMMLAVNEFIVQAEDYTILLETKTNTTLDEYPCLSKINKVCSLVTIINKLEYHTLNVS